MREERNAQTDSYRLCVRSNGVALPLSDLERVCELFFPTGACSAEGPAIGLAIDRCIGQHCGGQGWAESSLDRGTTFIALFPRELGKDPPEAANEPGQERADLGSRGQ